MLYQHRMDGMTNQTTTHHPDCDEWMFAHHVHIRHVRKGRGMFAAHCEDCEWRGRTYGPDCERTAHQEGAKHQGSMVPCDGRCQKWDDES